MSWSKTVGPVWLRADVLRGFLDTWEAEHGELRADEIRHAEAELGLRPGAGTRTAIVSR